MSLLNEAILINYKRTITYENEPVNVIGATTDITLRTIETYDNTDAKHVRKFGTDYLITDVTDIEDPIDVNMTFKVYALDGTLLGSRTGGGAFVDGSTVSQAQGCYLEIEASGGAVTILASITIDTDVDTGGLAFTCPAESVADGDTLRLYLSDTSSTYYDADYKYGGARHTPTGVSRLPYFDPNSAYAVLGGAFDKVVVLDSATYDYEFTFSTATSYVFAALGQTPTLTSGIGARTSQEVTTQYNNLTAVYFNENGNDVNAGTWQEPKESVSQATAVGFNANKAAVYGGSGASANVIINFTSSLGIAIGVAGDYIIESDYGYNLTFRATASISSIINMGTSNEGLSSYGIIYDGNNLATNGLQITGKSRTMIEQDNTFKNLTNAITSGHITTETLTIDKCLFDNINGSCIAYTISGTNCTINIRKNIFKNFRDYGYSMTGGAVASTVEISNNIIYNSTGPAPVGVNIGGAIINGNIINNTIDNIDTGIKYNVTTNNATTEKNILTNCVTEGITSNVLHNIDYNSFYGNTSNYTLTGGSSTNETTTDLLYIDENNNKYGLGGLIDDIGGSLSPAYKSDGSENDRGANLRTVLIGANDVYINGFIIDGQDQYNNGIGTTGASDYTGMLIYWNDLINYNGAALDIYSGADTDGEIKNNDINNNGWGIALIYGGNIVEENLIYRNIHFGIYANYTAQSLDHNDIFLNRWGVYLGANISGIIFKNSISHFNTLYEIYSEVLLTIDYCCITEVGALNNITLDEHSFTDNPLFVNTNDGEEDFNIKTIELGYSVDSPCKDSADDDTDIGALQINRDIESDAWKKHELNYNPRNIDFRHEGKGIIKFEDGTGSLDLFMKDDKRIYVFKYAKRQYMDETDRKKLEYFNTLVQGRVNSLTKDDTKLRLAFKPTDKLLTGTSATVDATARTLEDTSLSLVENEFKGFWMTVQFETGSGMVINPTTKKGLVSGAGWTTNEHQGRFFFHNGYYYRILSNDSDEVVFSDPNDTLISETVNYSIEKYFRITSNTEDIFCLADPDSELISGTYDYYINFIEVKVQNPKTAYTQLRYFYQKEEWKTGLTIAFEET